MNEVFRQHVEALHPRFEALMSAIPTSFKALSNIADKSGIYLLSEGSEHLYVGRTKKLRSRLRMHIGGDPAGASFAVKLARQQTGRHATYKSANALRVLRLEPVFVAAFGEARARIRLMDIRVVEEPDCNRQALLEIYATLSLNTCYNDFETH
jgi:predicted GIY-YIG superfamily endonuclease